MNNQLTHLDLFSGIGGFGLAARWNGLKTIAFCEKDKFCQKVLAKHWPEVPIHEDIKELQGNQYASPFILTGGFPCQPFSCAGKQRGKDDDRYLWPEMLRIISEARPDWILGENVTGIIGMGFDKMLLELEGFQYSIQTFIIPACSIGANHRRERVWVVANSDQRVRNGDGVSHSKPMEELGNRWETSQDSPLSICNGSGIKTDRRTLRRDDGFPEALDRVAALGNAIVPQVASEIIRCIVEIEDSRQAFSSVGV